MKAFWQQLVCFDVEMGSSEFDMREAVTLLGAGTQGRRLAFMVSS
jgi:hypothetical protein